MPSCLEPLEMLGDGVRNIPLPHGDCAYGGKQVKAHRVLVEKSSGPRFEGNMNPLVVARRGYDYEARCGKCRADLNNGRYPRESRKVYVDHRDPRLKMSKVLNGFWPAGCLSDNHHVQLRIYESTNSFPHACMIVD